MNRASQKTFDQLNRGPKRAAQLSKTNYKDYVTQTLREKGTHAGVKELFLQTHSQSSLQSADSHHNSQRDQSFVSLKQQSQTRIGLNAKHSQKSFADKELSTSNFPLERY